jgi:hypothetical protein
MIRGQKVDHWFHPRNEIVWRVPVPARELFSQIPEKWSRLCTDIPLVILSHIFIEEHWPTVYPEVLARACYLRLLWKSRLVVIIWKTRTFAKLDNNILFRINFLVRPLKTGLCRSLLRHDHLGHSAVLCDSLLSPSPQIWLSNPGEALPYLWQGCVLSAHSGCVGGSLWEGRTSVENDEMPRSPSRRFFSSAIFCYLERNLHASCC